MSQSSLYIIILHGKWRRDGTAAKGSVDLNITILNPYQHKTQQSANLPDKSVYQKPGTTPALHDFYSFNPTLPHPKNRILPFPHPAPHGIQPMCHHQNGVPLVYKLLSDNIQ